MFWPTYLLLAVVALPVAELVVFILVAAKIGFGWALLLALATSCAGALLLKHGGGGAVTRLRVVVDAERAGTLRAEAPGTGVLLCGILLLIPGFITDLAGLLLLIPPLRRALGRFFRGATTRGPPTRDAVVDLKRDEWQRVPQPRLPDENSRDPR